MIYDDPRWYRGDTVGAWRQRRLHSVIDPLLAQEASWLTVGDGRFGSDAVYLHDHGRSALASDLHESTLKKAREAGDIPDYSVENGEELSFPDGTFDFVLSKEALHHFSRASLGLHEMIRVAREGVLLIEPNDHRVSTSVREALAASFHDFALRLLGQRAPKHRFEVEGNYLYGISRREIEKTALGLGLPAIAVRELNDHHPESWDEAPARRGNVRFQITRIIIAVRDVLCRAGLFPPMLLAAVIFKHAPDSNLRKNLSASGFRVIDLDKNPYLKEAS